MNPGNVGIPDTDFAGFWVGGSLVATETGARRSDKMPTAPIPQTHVLFLYQEACRQVGTGLRSGQAIPPTLFLSEAPPETRQRGGRTCKRVGYQTRSSSVGKAG